MNKEELVVKIHGEYKKNNIGSLIKLSNEYFSRFGWDVELLKSLISILILQKRFLDAQEYINVLFSDLKEYALGYFFNASISLAKGEITMARATFKKAMKLGISPEYIEGYTGLKM